MRSSESLSDLDEEVFCGPVTQRELIITWRKRRQERLKREQAEALKSVENVIHPIIVASEEPALKKTRVETEEHQLRATIGGQSSENKTEANQTANIVSGSEYQLQDMICDPAENEGESGVFRTDKCYFENEPKKPPITPSIDVSVNGNTSEIQNESLSRSIMSSNPKTEVSVYLMQKAEDVTPNKIVVEEVSQSNVAVSSSPCNTASPLEDVSITDKSCENQALGMTIPLEDNHEGPMALEESTPNQPVAVTVETQSKEANYYREDQSINEICNEINESVREPIGGQRLSLEPESHQSGNLGNAADEKADGPIGMCEKFVDEASQSNVAVSSSPCNTASPLEDVSITDKSCENQESGTNVSLENNREDPMTVEESTRNQLIAEPAESESKEASFYSADQSISEICSEINESVRKSITEQRLSLEPETVLSGKLGNAADEKVDDRIGRCEKSVDEASQSNAAVLNSPCNADSFPEDVFIADKSCEDQELGMTIPLEDNHEGPMALEESTRNQPVTVTVETQSKEASFYSEDQSIIDISCEINESVREPIGGQRLSLEPETHQSGNLGNAADEQIATRMREKSVDEASQSNAAVSNSSYNAALLPEDVSITDKSCENQESDMNFSLEDNHEGPMAVEESTRNQPVAVTVETQSKEGSFYSEKQSINEIYCEINESVREPVAEQRVSLDLETHQSGNLGNAADEKVATRTCDNSVDEASQSNAAVSSSPCNTASPLEDVSIIDKSCENQESDVNFSLEDNHDCPMTVKESTHNQPVAVTVETQSKEASYYSEDQSINEVCCGINESVREPIGGQRLSLEPETHHSGNLGNAADDKIAIRMCEKSVDASLSNAAVSSSPCNAASPPEDVSITDKSCENQDSDMNVSLEDNHDCPMAVEESTPNQPVAVKADQSINEICCEIRENVREPIGGQQSSLDPITHQSGNLGNAADEKANDPIEMCEKFVDEASQSNVAVSSSPCNTASPLEDFSVTDKSCENQESGTNVLLEDNREDPMTVEESARNQLIAEPAESQSKDTSFYSADQSINEICCGINESQEKEEEGRSQNLLTESITEPQLSLEPEPSHQGFGNAADEKVDDQAGICEKFVDAGQPNTAVSSSPCNTASPLEDVSITDMSCEDQDLGMNVSLEDNHEHPVAVEESTRNRRDAVSVETPSKEGSFYSAERSINEICNEINESVREPIGGQPVSLEPEAVQCGHSQAAAYEKDADDQTGNCGKFEDEPSQSNPAVSSISCKVSPPAEEVYISDHSCEHQKSDLNDSSNEGNHGGPTLLQESTPNLPIAEPVETQSKEASFYSADRSISEMSVEVNDSVREPTGKQQLSLEPDAQQSTHLQAAADRKSLEEACLSNADVSNTSCKIALSIEDVPTLDRSCENQVSDTIVPSAEDHQEGPTSVQGNQPIQYAETVPKSNIPKSSIIKPSKLNVDLSTLNTSWVKRINMSKIPKPKRPFYVQPLDKQ